MESDTAYTTPLKGSDFLRVQIHLVSEIAKQTLCYLSIQRCCWLDFLVL